MASTNEDLPETDSQRGTLIMAADTDGNEPNILQRGASDFGMKKSGRTYSDMLDLVNRESQNMKRFEHLKYKLDLKRRS